MPFPFEIILKRPQAAFDDAEVIEDEIGKVILVDFSVQKRARVLLRLLANDRRDREVFRQPIAILQHRPIEKGSRRSPIAIDEGMIVSQPKVQKDRLDRRMTFGSLNNDPKFARSFEKAKSPAIKALIAKANDEGWNWEECGYRLGDTSLSAREFLGPTLG